MTEKKPDPAKQAAGYKGEITKITKNTVISPRRELIPEDYKKLVINFIKFVAPSFAIFFAQLALGVEPKLAFMVALLGFYQILSDWLSKWSGETTYKTTEK